MKRYKKTLKPITPLSKFPTEALLEMYRRHRTCYDHSYSRTECRWKNGKYTYWEPVYGEFVDIDGLMSNKPGTTFNIPLYYKIVPKPIKVISTEIEGNKWRNSYTDKIYRNGFGFDFQGMYWEGEYDELKRELDSRPHVNMQGRKAFRKWKMEYNKRNKK